MRLDPGLRPAPCSSAPRRQLIVIRRKGFTLVGRVWKKVSNLRLACGGPVAPRLPPTYAVPMRKLISLAALLAGAACTAPSAPPGVTVDQAIITLPAVPGRPGASYFTLRTEQDGVRLSGITSPTAGRIELHETVEEAGISRMVTIESPTLVPGEPLIFEPGGRHAMLFDLDPALRPGGKMELIFHFDPAPSVTVTADLRGAGDVGHDGH